MAIMLKRSDFTTLLLNWYDKNVYPLPWRINNDPYRVWLSEIMLQQTQVRTVIPYYNRWLRVLPSVNAVARANLEYILKKWEGLGYYARARNFHSACKAVEDIFKGKIPENYQDFQSLPGVGPYIAGAVLSIAYNLPMPAVDCNAYRVISRIKSINLPFNSCKNEIAEFLSIHIPSDRPGDFNQAIMDVGREICTLKNPACNSCPIRKHCNAFVNNAVDKYPLRTKHPKKPHYRVAVGIIWKKDKILISKRKENGLLGGLWEFPGGKIKNGEGAKKCIVREVNEELGVCVRPGKFLKQIKHAYTHFSITLDAYHCDYVDGIPGALGCADWRWIKLGQISQFPFPKANHKLFSSLVEDVSIC